MPPPGVDPLDSWLRERLGTRLVAREPVGGGCVHSAWRVHTADGGRLFVKTNRADQLPLFEAEADGLAALARVAPPCLVIPTPLALGLSAEGAVLVLPWLEFARGQAPPGVWAACGADLARLHRDSLQVPRLEAPGPEAHGPEAHAGAFGWERDNVIGASPQLNGWRTSWSTFFWECRLRPQLTWLARKGVAISGGERLRERLPAWLEGHGAQPCLVHGDLWSGNAAPLAQGGASLFDPAVYRGDREVDLAMARLFGGFPEAFFNGYNEVWPLEEGWRARMEIYNLYHVLNHANLFGGGYSKQAQNMVDTMLGL